MRILGFIYWKFKNLSYLCNVKLKKEKRNSKVPQSPQSQQVSKSSDIKQITKSPEIQQITKSPEIQQTQKSVEIQQASVSNNIFEISKELVKELNIFASRKTKIKFFLFEENKKNFIFVFLLAKIH